MKKDVVMTVRSFSKKISLDLKKNLKITLEGIFYSRVVKLRKFQLVTKKFNWYLMLKVYSNLSSSKIMGNQGWCMDDIRESMK